MEYSIPLFPKLIDKNHIAKLGWFQQYAEQEIPYSSLDRMRLVTKAKGIFKPANSEYALSIRQVLGSSYDDSELDLSPDGRWRFFYHQEDDPGGHHDKLWTNQSLLACIRDKVPVGVLKQLLPKPRTTYLVVGLGIITDWRNNRFVVDGPIAFEAQSRTREFREQTIAEFDPMTVGDTRESSLVKMNRRRGQPLFRAKLLEAYGRRCAVTGSRVVDVLEAAHIVPYRGEDTNHIQNGLLLRADHHKLFDLGLVSVDESKYTLKVSRKLRSSEYAGLDGTQLVLPSNDSLWPSQEALRMHRDWAESQSS